MGMTKEIMNILLDLKKKNIISDFTSVVNIGSQDIVNMNKNDFISLLNISENNIIKKEFNKKRISTKIFYDYFGFKKYKAIDLDGYNALKLDLNEDININEQFSFIYNGGTSEHIFNQKQLFENIHKLCKKDGLMLHLVPSQGAFNHGFYCYQPYFFYKLADVNKYTIESLWIIDLKSNYYDYFDLSYETIYNNFSPDVNDEDWKVLLLLILLRKNQDNEFKIPNNLYFNREKNGWKGKIVSKFYAKEIFLKKFGNIKRVAIFGCGEAGKIAFDFLKKLDIEIVCFLDDFKEGKFNNIVIKNRKDFFKKEDYKNVDAICIGPFQKGVDEKKFKNVKIVDLSGFWILK